MDSDSNSSIDYNSEVYSQPGFLGKKIVLCGNIGVGKSTLCEQLAKELKGTIVRENFGANPYLELYYGELKKNIKPNKYALGSQLFFLKETFDTHQGTSNEEIQIFDRSLHENIAVFAESLASMGIMSEIDAEMYRKIAKDYLSRFSGYDRKSDEKNPTKRPRDGEKSIDAEYLAQLNKLYDSMFDMLMKEEEQGDKIIFLDNTYLSEKETLEEVV
eukprot:CAMPEP_0176463230 /NCGR_PEP_ID=MMETSP0127-20121128/35750_1 /TAXON_ID=938130 /ORGANISM="Platyophrya macrostoma, Strain WH" /LENGTH=215 /DNA_ID=CAMNT_0017855321 /DNA_START=25 /DNA_END=669 /DNA_ORIENTATION=+